MTKREGGGFQLKMNLTAIENAYEEIIGSANIKKEFNGEVLFIKGAKSNYISDEDIELILNLYPNAQIKPVENSGHWVHAENYEGFLEALH
jgi:esterase